MLSSQITVYFCCPYYSEFNFRSLVLKICWCLYLEIYDCECKQLHTCMRCSNILWHVCRSKCCLYCCFVCCLNQGGDALESVYPYSGTSGNKCAYVASDNVATFSSYLNVTQFNETALMIASSQAVISVGIDASSIYFQLYSSGIRNFFRVAVFNI